MSIVMGILLILSGVGIVGVGLFQKWEAGQTVSARGQNDTAALSKWITGAAKSVTAPTAASDCGGGAPSSDAFALVQFTSLNQYHYSAVAVDGTWDDLQDRSMVHWHGSPGPGGSGNMIIAFHREPNFQYIDQLGKGGTVTIEDRKCNTYVYTITDTWTLDPNHVTELSPTNGHQITLITCTPWWQDYNRLVWRGTLTSINGQVFNG